MAETSWITKKKKYITKKSDKKKEDKKKSWIAKKKKSKISFDVKGKGDDFDEAKTKSQRNAQISSSLKKWAERGSKLGSTDRAIKTGMKDNGDVYFTPESTRVIKSRMTGGQGYSRGYPEIYSGKKSEKKSWITKKKKKDYANQ